MKMNKINLCVIFIFKKKKINTLTVTIYSKQYKLSTLIWRGGVTEKKNDNGFLGNIHRCCKDE